MIKLAERFTVPQCFVGETHIGGYDEFVNATHEGGKLKSEDDLPQGETRDKNNESRCKTLLKIKILLILPLSQPSRPNSLLSPTLSAPSTHP